jgi:4-amino-4-deoxy-L-arabinose transferase-like glycosyltransferase
LKTIGDNRVNKMPLQQKLQVLFYLLFAGIIAFPIFAHLGNLPLRVWDESRLAVSAMEMMQNKNYLVVHYNGIPDLWNTKPPFLIWLQVASMKLFGTNESAFRLPSALAALATCLLLIRYSYNSLKNYLPGVFASLVLVTSPGFMGLHGARTGDYDAVLSFFIIASVLSFLRFLETNKSKSLYLSFVALTLAVLTKGIAGLMFLPALFVISLLSKKFSELLQNRHFYIGLFIFVLSIAGYYLLREMANSGYWEAVVENELGGRFLETTENHRHGFWFYFQNLLRFRLPFWIYILPIATAMGVTSNIERIKIFSIYNSILITLFWLIISISQTKLFWYDLPLYPLISIQIGISIYIIFDYLKEINYFNVNFRYNVLPVSFVFLLFILPYQNILGKNYKPAEPYNGREHYIFSDFLRKSISAKSYPESSVIVYEGYHAHLLFYTLQLSELGIEAPIVHWSAIEPGDTVLAHQQEVMYYLESKFTTHRLASFGSIEQIEIQSFRTDSSEVISP